MKWFYCYTDAFSDLKSEMRSSVPPLLLYIYFYTEFEKGFTEDNR